MGIGNVVGCPAAAKKPKYQLGMKDNGKGSVLIYLVDNTGHSEPCGQLLRIGKRTGKVTFLTGIDRKYGFDLNTSGQLRVRSA